MITFQLRYPGHKMQQSRHGHEGEPVYQRCVALVLTVLLLLLSFYANMSEQQHVSVDCTNFWGTNVTGTYEKCESIKENLSYGPKVKLRNMLFLSGAYCFNNGSGLCKGIAGRFEFYFNVFQDKIIGPAPKSKYVDQYGYHQRVPRAYNINGDILYHDRSINWSRNFRKSLKNKTISLLSINDFNWCGYVKQDWWPYKSAINDAKNRFWIYFFNRQSCIVNAASNKTQHYNTRFLHNSSLRIDLDMNPTIFAMQDNLAKGEFRLVKHKRQHWYEVRYRVRLNPAPGILYFVEMGDTDIKPCIVDGVDGHILSRKAYRNFSNVCVDDTMFRRVGKNSPLVQWYCGTEEHEIADYNYPQYVNDRGVLIEASIHNIPRHPKTTQSFFGVKVDTDPEWEEFAKDGFVFTATTTIPIGNSTSEVRVICLYANFKSTQAANVYDENYPMPYLSDYTTRYKKTQNGNDWVVVDRAQKAKQVKNLNYVDDIAYLHKCNTILVIFGPLYTELPPDKFSLDTKAPVDSIYDLGMWELTNAFFAMPDGTNSLWAYHRLNFIAEYKYTCAKGPNSLVTAKKATGKYYIRAGSSMPQVFERYDWKGEIDTTEETFLRLVGVYKGNAEPREAPDPALYPLPADSPAQPQEERDNTLMYIIIGIGALLIFTMCIICLVTLRRRRKRRQQEMAASSLGPSRTARSSMPSRHSSSDPSARSKLISGSRLSRGPTRRSSIGKMPTAKTRITLRSGFSPGGRASGTSSTRTPRSGLGGQREILSSSHRPIASPSSTHRSSLSRPSSRVSGRSGGSTKRSKISGKSKK